MARLIDATRIEQYILNNCSYNEEINAIYAEIINAPTVDPIRHGRWLKIESGDWANATEYRCSECGKYRLAVNPVDYNWNYCPDCGARMDMEKCYEDSDK